MEFTQDQQNALMKYEEIKLQIKELETELDPLKEIIVPLMEKGRDLTTETGGTFKLKERANWKFSPDTVAKKKELKTLEEEEIAKGIATNKPTVYLEYSSAKSEKGEE